MPKRHTKFVKNGIYHVIQRGNNKAFIFENAADKLYFLKIVETVKKKHPFTMLYYVLMDNHYHMIIEMEEVSISLIMQVIHHKYSIYFNRKYDRTGTIFDSTFKAYAVFGQRYFRKLILYIAHNPVQAKIVENLNHYKWCAHGEIVYSKTLLISRERLFQHLKEGDKHGGEVYKELLDEKVSEKYKKLEVNQLSKAIAFDANQEILNALMIDYLRETHGDLELLFSDKDKSERAKLRRDCVRFASQEGFSIKEVANYLKLSKCAVSKICAELQKVAREKIVASEKIVQGRK